MLHVLFPVLGGLRVIKRVLVFTKIFSFDLGSSIKLLQSKIPVINSIWCDFTQGRCFLLIPLKLSEVPADYALCCMFVFPCLGVRRGAKRVLAFPQTFSFDLGGSIKLLSIEIEKSFLLSMVRFYPDRTCYLLCRVKHVNEGSCAGLSVQTFARAARKSFRKHRPCCGKSPIHVMVIILIC